MEYQALYRKYRPQRFDEVVGQSHVTHTLAREVVEGKVAHAYLFAGPRGTGKTTTARLLAKSLNCENRGPEGEPDNTCPSCVGITIGTSLDVIELDAASHNKVEDVREIRINVGTVAAAAGAHRIYILDEAHMLSRAAGNALLKTLEEPPEHVVFVLATTEPYKLLDTIRSRSQRFDFHPVGSDILIGHLADIAGREAIDVDDAAMAMIAAHAGGSVRDAMSLLEQVAALGDGTVRTDIVTRALGLADRDAFGKLATSVVGGDAPAALALVAELASRGADLRRFVAEAIEYFRGIFLAQYAPNLEEVVDESADVIADWRRRASEIAAGDVLRVVDTLGETLLQLRQGREERLVIELALLRLTRPETAPDAASLVSRIDRLESRLRSLDQRTPSATSPDSPESKPAAAPPQAPAPPVSAEPAAAAPEPPRTTEPEELAVDTANDEAPFAAPVPPVPEPSPAVAPAGSAELMTTLDLASFETVWPALVARVRDAAGPVRHALVKVAVPGGVEDGVVQLEIPSHMPFHLERLREDSELSGTMTGIAAELLGGNIGIAWVAAADAPASTTPAEPQRAPDKDDLLEESDDDVVDPADMVVDVLGGEIISE